MTSSRGSFPTPCGTVRDRAILGQKRSKPGVHLRRRRACPLTLDGGFASIGGSGGGKRRPSGRLFDIVIGRKGNADGGVLASRLLRSRRRDSDGLAFRKPMGVLRAILKRIA